MLEFRDHHIMQILSTYDVHKGPLDRWIHLYFRQNKALGSKDRAEVAQIVYELIRWKGLLDALQKGGRWPERLELFRSLDFNKKFEELASHERVSFPQGLWNRLAGHWGEEKTSEFCRASNEEAPVTVRINPLKTTREKVMAKWKEEGFAVEATKQSPYGIILKQRVPLFGSEMFKEGWFEMQDEGSQLVAFQVEAKPGEKVMDYCAGAGGKTLAFAPAMKGKGQIYLHDIRSEALFEARRRLKRAGIQNGQIIQSDASHLKLLKKKMDWVLVDAPCSGTGTLRRNPDMKWRFSDLMLDRLINEQKMIFERALSYVKPGGKIVYATCSVLPEENSQQMEYFLKSYPLELAAEPFEVFPAQGGMDGFYAACCEKR